ncbi:MAG: sulfotransferase family protein [Phycisphaerales bacterium]
MVNRPAFLILGAMKCGTTSLAESLVQQTNVVFPCGKEPRVLNREPVEYEDAIDSYIQSMNSADPSKLVGDASPQSTFRDDLTAQRAMDIYGAKLRMVYIVRDPVARAVSHFKHAWQGGWKMASTADEAFEVEPMLRQVSCYHDRLARWNTVFAPENMLVIRFESMIQEQSLWIQRVCEHIGAEINSEDATLEHSNQAGEQGTPVLPGPIWRVGRAMKQIKAVHMLARSPLGIKAKGMLMKTEKPPQPSIEALERFAWSIQAITERFQNEQGWDESERWDLLKTARRLGKPAP